MLAALGGAAQDQPGAARQGDPALLADRSGAVLDRRAVPARPGRDQCAAERRAGDQRASRALPRRRRHDPDAAALPGRLPRRRTCSATRPRSPRPTRRRTRHSSTPTRSGASGLEAQYDAALRGVDGKRLRPARPAGCRSSAHGQDRPGGAGRHARHQHRRQPADDSPSSRWPSRSSTRRKNGYKAHRRRGRRDGPADRPDPRGRQLPDLRPVAVRRRHLQRRLREADLAGRRTTRCSNRAIGGAVRAGIDVQADHRVVAGHRTTRSTPPTSTAAPAR